MTTFTQTYLAEVIDVAAQVDDVRIEALVDVLVSLRGDGGRLFILGVGGSAANAEHAATDFRNLAGIQAYALDNTAILTGLTNDRGWEAVFVTWLQGCALSMRDAVLVLSVGGGNLERRISVNLADAIVYAQDVGAVVLAIVGRSDGMAAQRGDVCIVVPALNPQHVTQHAEEFQSIVWHLVVSHPRLKMGETKW